MGRFYNGDIEGKFWFGIQDSYDINNLINVIAIGILIKSLLTLNLFIY